MTDSLNQQLARKLGLFPLTNIVIANMIGVGIFTTAGLLMGVLNNPLLMLLLWGAGGLIAVFGALSYGELGAAFPSAGGEYIFLSKLYHPLLGFLSGWVSFIVGFSAPIAAASIGFSEYFTRAFPQFLDMSNTSGIVAPVLVKKVLSVSVILSFSLVHLKGIEYGTKIQNYLTILKVGMIVFLIAAGFTLGEGDFNHLYEGSRFTFDFAGWKSIGLSLMWIMFAFSGWNASTYIGSEIRNPNRNLPFSLLLGTGVVILLYICLNMLFIYAIPPEKMKGVIAIGGLAVDNLFGKSTANLFSLLISFALLSSISAFIILGPRVYYSMATEGYFFKFVSKVHPESNVPARAILLQSFISIVIVLSGSFDQILTYMGFSLGVFPIIAVMGVFRLRFLGKSTNKLPGYPLVQIIYILFGISMLLLAFLERPVEAVIAVTTVLSGIPVYFIFKKYN